MQPSLIRGLGLLLTLAWCAPAAGGDQAQRERGLRAIESMTGCYLVDYSYVETEAVRPGYARDPRVYDVNRRRSVKEWIFTEPVSPRRVRLQRVLFATDLSGTVIAGSELRHQSEDWEYDAPFLYEFVAPRRWEVKDLGRSPARTGRGVGCRTAGTVLR